MQKAKIIGAAGLAVLMGGAGIGISSLAGASAGIDPSQPSGSDGWYTTAGAYTTTANPGDTVSLTVTDVPPGSEDPNGTFAISWPTGTLDYVSNGDASASCAQAASGGLTVETCTYADLAHSSKSDSFTFTVSAPTGVTIPVQAVVTDTDDNTSDTAMFPLQVPAPAGQAGAPGTAGSAGQAGAQGPQGPAGANGANGTSATSTGSGYWLLAKDGGVFAYGGAQFYGSLPSIGATAPASNPATVIVPTVDKGGYWIVEANGAVFAFGDAQYAGGMSGAPLNAPMTAGAAS